MSVLAELTVPADEFVLTDTLRTVPGVRIEIKRVVAGTERVTPYFWAANEEFEDFEQALEDDPGVQGVLELEERGSDEQAQASDERFYRVAWKSETASIVSAIAESKATILEAVSDDGKFWELKVLFPGRDALSAFHDRCRSRDISFRLDRVYRPEDPEERGEYEVTEDQREGLRAAYDAGYFDVPRETTLTELADSLDISRNALSARLRRGQRNLLANTLVHDE